MKGWWAISLINTIKITPNNPKWVYIYNSVVYIVVAYYMLEITDAKLTLLLFWVHCIPLFNQWQTKWIAQIESKVPGGNWRNDGYKFKGKFLANYSHIRTSIFIFLHIIIYCIQITAIDDDIFNNDTTMTWDMETVKILAERDAIRITNISWHFGLVWKWRDYILDDYIYADIWTTGPFDQLLSMYQMSMHRNLYQLRF